MLKFRARKLSRCRLFPLGALTRGLAGEVLTEMAELTEAGCVGFSQADVALTDTLVLQRALQYAATFGYGVWLRPQDAYLGKGVAASGAVATRLGLSGVPVAAETIALHTLFELMRITGARVHLCRLSSAAGVALLRAAKAEGLPVTADVSINSLHLSDVDIGYFNADMRLTPPLRQGADRDALRAALADGTLDALVSDHNPVDDDAKTLPFGEAEPGATGLELLLSLALKWGDDAGVGLGDDAGACHLRPGARARRRASARSPPAPAGWSKAAWPTSASSTPPPPGALEPGMLKSQGKHTPFSFASTGMALPGRVRATLVAGTVAYEGRTPVRTDAQPSRRLAPAAHAGAPAARHGGDGAALPGAGCHAGGRNASAGGRPSWCAWSGCELQCQRHAATGRRRCCWPTMCRGSTSPPSMRWRRRRASSPRPTCWPGRCSAG